MACTVAKALGVPPVQKEVGVPAGQLQGNTPDSTTFKSDGKTAWSVFSAFLGNNWCVRAGAVCLQTQKGMQERISVQRNTVAVVTSA